MWVEKRSKNNFKFVEQYKDPLTDKPKRVSVTLSKNTAHTRKEAQAALEAKIRQRLRHLQDGSIKHGVTLGQLKDDWLKDREAFTKAKTYEASLSRAKKIVSELGEDVLVEKVTAPLLEDMLNNMIYKEEYKNSTVSQCKNAARLMFQYAVKHRYAKDNPAENLEISYRSDELTQQPEEKFLDDDELRKVLRYMYQVSPHYGRFCEFLYLTGMRYGEAAALTPDDVYKRADGKTVASVNGTLVHQVKQKSPKTVSSMREVVLPDRALLLIRKERISHPFGLEFIFASPRGNPLRNDVLNRQLHKAKTTLKINKKVTLHTFRHTHISKLAELGVPLYLIQNRVGHKDAEITKEIYLHVTKKAEEKLDSKLDFL